VHLILNRQLDQLLTRILPHLDQGRMIGATRTDGLVSASEDMMLARRFENVGEFSISA
jgi:hypothetical protein